MSKKKIIALIVLMFLSLPVFKYGGDKFSLFCRDNLEGSSYGLVSLGFVEAKGNIVSVVNFSSCVAGRDILTFVGIPIGNAGRDLVSVFGIPIGNAGQNLSSSVGIPIGNAGRDLMSFVGISIGNAGTQDSNGLLSIRFDEWGEIPRITGFWEGYYELKK